MTTDGMKSLRTRILELPEEEQKSRRAFFSDEEWEDSWELNALPFQLPPPGNDWRIWTIIAPPLTGSTTAALRWLRGQLSKADSISILILSGNSQGAALALRDSILTGDRKWISAPQTVQSSDGSALVRAATETTTRGELGRHYDVVFGDNILDAPTIVATFPSTDKFVFASPVKLPKGGLVSRAGDGRIY